MNDVRLHDARSVTIQEVTSPVGAWAAGDRAAIPDQDGDDRLPKAPHAARLPTFAR